MDLILLRRGMDEFGPQIRSWWLRSTGFLLMAWAFHYIPFFLMGRQLFLHHYMPAFIFSTMVGACLVDFIFRVSFIQPWLSEARTNKDATDERKATPEHHWNAHRRGGKGLWAFVIIALAIYTTSFAYFAPLSYGTGFDKIETLEKRKWFKSWDIQHARK